jgi:methionyl-tRNA synthetase
MERFAFDDARKEIWAFIGRANKYIDETMPWKLAKEPDKAAELDAVLMNLYEALRLAALLVAPVVPQTAQRMWAQLGLEGDPLKMLYDKFSWGEGAGTKIRKAEVLFPRIDVKEWQKAKEEKKKMEEENKAPAMEHEAEIEIDAFKAVEMRVAQIVKAEEIPKSRKLYKLEVDLGYEKRTVCSGIKAFFTTEELEGKRVILVTNLKPAKLCGIESNGMILAAAVKVDGNAESLTLVTPDGDIPLGSRVS